MKRLRASLIFVAALATVAALAAPAQAASSIGTPPPFDYVFGYSGFFTLPTVFGPVPAQIWTSARSNIGPNPLTGQNPKGVFRVRENASSIGLGYVMFGGPVTCLNVIETNPGAQTTAVEGGVVIFTSQPALIPTGTRWIAQYNDNYGAGAPPDSVDATTFGGGPPLTNCPPVFTFFGQTNVPFGWTEHDFG
jgi:hypothetical protein